MDKRMDGRNFSPFYRTSSPIGAAALLPIHVNYQIPKQGKGTADHMMPLGDWFLMLCSKHFSSSMQKYLTSRRGKTIPHMPLPPRDSACLCKAGMVKKKT